MGQLKKDNQTLRSQKKEIGEQLGEAKRSVEVLEYEKNELQIEAKSSLEKLAFLESRIRSVQGKGQLSHIVSTKQFGIKRNIE